jgi:structural maintenance of chromosome 4
MSDRDNSSARSDDEAAGRMSLAPGQVHQRLVIRELIVENFKSYAGRHRIGPFHKTFTAVIGPNGSGKSNVIDAMLFVFGKQAKKIRLEKLSELIHSSAAHPNLTSASVTVTFVEIEDDPADNAKWLELPGSAIAITREVQRNSTSQYFLNGTKSSQKDVVSFLIGKGVDLEHNRFLILQGEVEQIALMKPKAEKEGEEGLLEYFDDLIGTNRFIGAIKDASAAADRCQEERLGALDQLEKLRKERDALDSAKQQTMKFATKDNQLQNLLSIMCQQKIRAVEEALEEPRAQLKLVDDEIAAVKERSDALGKQKEEHQAAMKGHEKAVARIKKDVELTKAALQTKTEELENAKATIEDAEKQRKRENDKLKKTTDEISKLLVVIADNERDADFVRRQLEEDRCELEEKAPEFELQRERLQQELLPLHRELDRLSREAAPSAAAVAEAEAAYETAQQDLTDMQSRLGRTQTELERLRTEHDQRSRAVAQHSERLRTGTAITAELTAKLSKLEEEAEGVRRRIYDIGVAITQLTAQQQEEAADDKVASFLSAKRGLGYHGALRQLGNIDNRYDIAAGVAGGAVWGYHVVDSQDAATAAIQLLQENNLGRASFIPLDKITRELQAHIHEKVEPPPTTKRVFDLITCKPQYQAAFYFAVRNTLVAEDLKTAQRIGLGDGAGGRGLRVVTTQGELVEPGSVTGGGQTPQGARLRACPSAEDMAAMANRTSDLQKERYGLEQRRLAIKDESQHIAERLQREGVTPQQERQLVLDMKSNEAAMESISERIAVLQRDLKRLDSQSTTIDDAERACKTCLLALEAARERHRTFGERIRDVEVRKARVGGPDHERLRDRVNELLRLVREQEGRLQKATSAASLAQTTCERRKKDLEAHKKRLEEMAEAEDSKAKENIKRLSEEVARLEGEQRQHGAKMDELQEEFAATRKKIGDIEKQLNALDDERTDLERKRSVVMESMREKLDVMEKFAQKVRTCEEKITNNVLDFGLETWTQRREAQRNTDDADDDDDKPKGDDSDGRPADESLAAEDAALLKTFQDGTFSTKIANDEDLLQYEPASTKFLATQLSEEINKARDKIDFDAVARWRQKDIAHREQRAKYDDVRQLLADAETRLETLKAERKDKFMSVFQKIQRHLKEMYQLLASGGDAEIELLDSSDPFEGINFVVRPPKKAWKNVSNLSGGEKTLSSLALVFALHHVKPTPVYVMDEIDAALDFRNVSIVARYVLERAIGAQFIIISLRNNMFELAHQLVGVCKVNDCTRSVVLNPASIAKHIETRAAQRRSGAARPALDDSQDNTSRGLKAHRVEAAQTVN